MSERPVDARRLKAGTLRKDVDLIAASHAELLRQVQVEAEREDLRHEQVRAHIDLLNAKVDVLTTAFIELVAAVRDAAKTAADATR